MHGEIVMLHALVDGLQQLSLILALEKNCIKDKERTA